MPSCEDFDQTLAKTLFAIKQRAVELLCEEDGRVRGRLRRKKDLAKQDRSLAIGLFKLAILAASIPCTFYMKSKLL